MTPRQTPESKSGSGATRDRILNAAEQSFVERGFESTSLREITARAGANLAAVNYHFGSKEALIREVFERRLRVINAERLDELDQAESKAGGRPLAPDKLIEAFLLPVLRMSKDRVRGGHNFIRLLGRAYTEPTEPVRKLLADEYVEVIERFKRALFQALPEIPEKELIWRMHFALGAMSYAIAGTDSVQMIASYEVRDTDRIEAIMRRIVPFIVAGLTAPVPAAVPSATPAKAPAAERKAA
jgi:AcrR family transcriptional regulator